MLAFFPGMRNSCEFRRPPDRLIGGDLGSCNAAYFRYWHLAGIAIELRDVCRLLINIQHSIVEVISRDRFDQLPREGCFGFSTRGSAILQQRQGSSVQPDGALAAVGSAMSASWRSQADPGLGAAHFECTDLAPKLLSYLVCPHATSLDHLWYGGEHGLRQNYTSHFDHPPLTILVRYLVAALTLLVRGMVEKKAAPRGRSLGRIWLFVKVVRLWLDI